MGGRDSGDGLTGEDGDSADEGQAVEDGEEDDDGGQTAEQLARGLGSLAEAGASDACTQHAYHDRDA